MIGRPNLARLHCDRFSVFFHLSLPSVVESGVLTTTHHHRDDDGNIFAYYGKSYRHHGVAYVAQGSIFSHDPENYHINFSFVQSDRGRPPAGYESPDRLLEIALEIAPIEPVELDVRSNYTYDMDDGWSPRLPLPMEMPKPISSVRGTSFTHIEGVRLSKKVEAKTPEWIQMNVSDDGEITHEVGILRMKVLNSNTIGSLFREVSRMSLGMVTQKEDKTYGD